MHLLIVNDISNVCPLDINLRNARFKEIAVILEVGITSLFTLPLFEKLDQMIKIIFKMMKQLVWGAPLHSWRQQQVAQKSRETFCCTATTIATNPNWSKSVPVRILFDNGSLQSYVTDSLKSKIGLSSTSSETLHLNTFGENAYQKQQCQVVTLPLKTKTDEFVEISALNFSVNCSPLTKRVNIDRYPHLRYLELADHSEPGQ